MIMCDVFMITFIIFLWNYESNVEVQYLPMIITGLPYLDNVAMLSCIDEVIMT
jgi:hypothetical protein